ncbi:MAG: DUF4412 domain-containing protein [Chitinophagales bacterium]|nr:DUF4412 domain-containing protein [Chitinophagales bacterium]
MKNFILLLSLIFVSTFGFAQSPFVGHIELESQDPSNEMKLLFSVNDSLTSLKLNSKGKTDIRVIINPKQKKFTTLVNGAEINRLGIVSPIKDQRTPQESGFTIEKTNEKRKILDYDCTRYKVFNETDTLEAWIADQFDYNPLSVLLYMSEKDDNNILQLLTNDLHGLIMQVDYLTEKKEPASLKITHIDEIVPDEADFSTEGYNIIGIEKLQKAFGN